jgi:hypothetical protein
MKVIKIQTPKLLVGCLVLFATTTGASYQIFSNQNKPHQIISTVDDEAKEKTASKFDFDPNAPKTEVSPINGIKVSKEELTFLTKRLPLGVMVENHVEARPQSGLTAADVVYEAVAEGGITRFLAIYWNSLEDVTLAPVRSIRTYFLDWISEYDGLLSHVGGANCNLTTGSGCANGAPADALGQIEKYGIKSLNQYFVGLAAYERRYERLERTVATEHTMISSTNKLWQVAEDWGWTGITEEGSWLDDFRPWKFKDDLPEEEHPSGQTIEFGFWEGMFSQDFQVLWEYNPQTNSYLRSTGGTPLLDLNNDQQIMAKNVVVLFMTERPANDGYPGNVRLLYDTIGQGEALIFQDGQETEAVWEKESRTDRTLFYDENGKEIQLTRGSIWIEILPAGNEVEVKTGTEVDLNESTND